MQGLGLVFLGVLAGGFERREAGLFSGESRQNTYTSMKNMCEETKFHSISVCLRLAHVAHGFRRT